MISVQLQGNLGNHLWQYALCRGLAERLGTGFHIPRSFQGGGLFPAISLGEDREEGISSVFYERGEHWHTQPYDPSILLGNGDGTRICGFFQSERYLWDIGEEKVKEWFSLKDLPPSNTFELA